jgi:hypothetical protein
MFPICSYNRVSVSQSGNRRFDASPGGCRLIFDIVDQKTKAAAERVGAGATSRLTPAQFSAGMG